MDGRSRKYVWGMTVLGLFCGLAFQNCSVAPDSKTETTLNKSNVTVICSPANDCMSYRLTTYPFNNNDCLGSSNKVQLDNLPSANGSVTNILWNNCLSQSATDACCPQGLITGSFRTFSGDRSLSVSFENTPGNIYNKSNKSTQDSP